VDAVGVPPVHPAQGGELDVVDRAPRSLFGASDQLGLVERVDCLGQRVVIWLSDQSRSGVKRDVVGPAGQMALRRSWRPATWGVASAHLPLEAGRGRSAPVLDVGSPKQRALCHWSCLACVTQPRVPIRERRHERSETYGERSVWRDLPRCPGPLAPALSTPRQVGAPCTRGTPAVSLRGSLWHGAVVGFWL